MLFAGGARLSPPLSVDHLLEIPLSLLVTFEPSMCKYWCDCVTNTLDEVANRDQIIELPL